MDIAATKKQWSRYQKLVIADNATQEHHEIMASRVPYLLDEIDLLNNHIKLLENIHAENERGDKS